MKKGDVVLVDFTALELLNGETFETTLEADAKAANVFNPRATYKPVPMVIGKNDLFPMLEKELEGMEIGQEKKVELEPKDAFGERSAAKIALLSLREFTKQNMRPVPGLVIEADGQQGKVQSVSGGRVRVDFNHPLAGKKVSYKLIVRKKIGGKEEQVSALLEKFFPHVNQQERKITVENEKAIIELPERLKEQKETELLKQLVSKMFPEQLEWLKTVEFAKASGKTENKTESAERKAQPAESKTVQAKTAETEKNAKAAAVPLAEKK